MKAAMVAEGAGVLRPNLAQKRGQVAHLRVEAVGPPPLAGPQRPALLSVSCVVEA